MSKKSRASDETTFIQFVVSEELLRNITELRRWEPDLPSRNDFIRRLLKEAVQTRIEAAQSRKDAMVDARIRNA